MPERSWRGLLVTTEEVEATRDEASSGHIVRVEIDDIGEFCGQFPDEVAKALDVESFPESMVLRNEREFWDESEEVEADE
jgi:hypothetical protein